MLAVVEDPVVACRDREPAFEGCRCLDGVHVRGGVTELPERTGPGDLIMAWWRPGRRRQRQGTQYPASVTVNSSLRMANGVSHDGP